MTRARVRLLVASMIIVPLAVAPLSALAQDGGSADSRVGSYVGAGFAFGSENFDRNDASNVDDAYGGDFWLGFRLSQNWAVETQIEYLRGFDLTVDPLDGDGSYITATLNAKIFPLAQVMPSRLEPFLFVGAGVGRIQISLGSTSDLEEVAFLVRTGGGIDFYVVENVAIQVSTSFVQPTQDLNNFSYVSTVAGIQYRF